MGQSEPGQGRKAAALRNLPHAVKLSPVFFMRQFTATVYVFHEDKVLLHCHPKFGKWLPSGGHIEPNETPPEAARREVLEETGLEIAFLEQENLKVAYPHAVTLERPFLCLLEQIPASQKQEAHEHIDFIYIARPLHFPVPTSLPNGFQWLTYEQAIAKELFADTRQILSLLLREESPYQRR